MAGYKSSRLILPTVLAASVMMLACSNPFLERFRAEFGWAEARLTEDGWLKSRELPPPRRGLLLQDPGQTKLLQDFEAWSRTPPR